MKRIISEQYERATKLMTEKRAALDSIAEALLEFETIEGKHVMEIIEHGEIRSEVISSLPEVPADDEPASEKGDGKQEPEAGIGGTPNPAPSPA